MPSAAWTQDLYNNFNGPGRNSSCRPNKGSSAFPAAVSAVLIPSYPFGPSSPRQQLWSALDQVPSRGLRSEPSAMSDATPSRDHVSTWRTLLSLKEISDHRERKGRIRLQAFNVFNHPALDLPNSSGAQGGWIVLAGGAITNIDPNIGMRQFQFALRVEF